MNKNLLTVSFLFLTICGCLAQSANYPISRKLKSNVHIVEETSTFYENGRIITERHIKKFDSQGRLIEIQTLDKDLFMLYWEIFKYVGDEKDFVKWYRYGTEEIANRKEVRTESKPGHHTYTYYDKEKKIGTIERQWDEKEIRITNYYPTLFENPITYETIQYEDGKPIRHTKESTDIQEFKYNEKGDCIEDINSFYTEDTQEQKTYISTYTYEYDSIGNWIKQSTTDKETGTLMRIIERTITYY